MYRRRDSGRAYSSADAYRNQAAVSPTSSASHAPPSSSSEEDAHLTSPDLRRTASPSPADSSAEQHDDSTLAPPRPFFLAGSRKDSNASDRGSWSSSVGESVEPASDSDNTDREAAAAAAAAAVQPAARRVRANTAGTAGPTRPRNHQRRRSSQGSPSDPFDTPVQTPITPSSPPRAPPSAFPFLSHAGNPDPIPGSLARRSSRDSFRRSSLNGLPNSPATATGVAYPTSPGNVDGYSALREERTSMDVADGYAYAPAYAPVNGHDQDELGRPHPPFMGEAERGSYMGTGGGVYRNSAAAAMTGSSAALAGGKCLPSASLHLILSHLTCRWHTPADEFPDDNPYARSVPFSRLASHLLPLVASVVPFPSSAAPHVAVSALAHLPAKLTLWLGRLTVQAQDGQGADALIAPAREAHC